MDNFIKIAANETLIVAIITAANENLRLFTLKLPQFPLMI
jgi:hypothetical protein